MDNVQAILTVSVPTLAVLVGILVNNSRLAAFRSHVDQRFDAFNERLGGELRRVKEVLDARLKHLEER